MACHKRIEYHRARHQMHSPHSIELQIRKSKNLYAITLSNTLVKLRNHSLNTTVAQRAFIFL